MSEKQLPPPLLSTVAISIVAFSLLNLLVFSFSGEPTAANIAKRGIRLLFTCGLIYAMWRGASWARWVTVIVTLATSIVSASSFWLASSSISILYRSYGLFIGLFYCVSASLLVLAPSIRKYFCRSHLSISNALNDPEIAEQIAPPDKRGGGR